ncbi:reverse transcriptase domain-containing protein [Tanacetum coccineum]|uniref:Reverse transcriptase domain-containing protein n=1 Tax=Tanacetum coccineum TaxID=301880 RepID=A0ABQ5HHY0_9ASTR
MLQEDILVDVAGYVYPVDFVILDIKEDEKRPYILGTPFMTTAKAVIKFDKGTITLRTGKSKMSFHKIHEFPCKIERVIKNDIEPIAPTMTMNRLVLEWEERIIFYMEKEMELYLIRRSLEVLRKFHWMILGGRFNQLSLVSSLLFSKPGEYYGTNALSKFSIDTELVLHPLQDKLTSRDKSLDLSAFKLSRLFFSLLSSGLSSCWRSYRAQ